MHNTRTRKTIFRPAPLHVLTREVKALKNTEPAPVTVKERLEARAALGHSFGTKKAQAAIRAQERNKVDVNAMQGVMEHVVDGIEKGVEALPTQGELSPRSTCFLSTLCCYRADGGRG